MDQPSVLLSVPVRTGSKVTHSDPVILSSLRSLSLTLSHLCPCLVSYLHVLVAVTHLVGLFGGRDSSGDTFGGRDSSGKKIRRAVTHLVELYCGRDSSGQIFGRAVTHLLGAHKNRRSRDSSGHTLWGP